MLAMLLALLIFVGEAVRDALDPRRALAPTRQAKAVRASTCKRLDPAASFCPAATKRRLALDVRRLAAKDGERLRSV